MTLVKRNSGYYSAIPSLLDSFFSGDWQEGNYNKKGNNGAVPAVNVRENNDNFYLEVAAPGLKKEDFNVKVENDQLTISAMVKNENEGDAKGYTRKEFGYQSFSRSFTVAREAIDMDAVAAKYENGILYLTLPKREEVKAKPVREIQIS